MRFTNRYVIENRNRILFLSCLSFFSFVYICYIFISVFDDVSDIMFIILNCPIIPIFLLFTLFYCLYVMLSIFRFYYDIKKMSDNDFSIIDFEMSDSNVFYYKNMFLLLTSNYVISLDRKFIFYKYSDILWIYSFAVGGIKYIKIMTSDGDSLFFTHFRIYGRYTKYLDYSREFFDYVKQKNPNVVIGYNSENASYFRKIKKEIRNSKKIGRIRKE